MLITCNAASTIMTNGIKRLLSPVTLSVEHPIDLMHSEFHELLQKNCDSRNQQERANLDEKAIKKLRQMSGQKISGKLLLCGLRQSIHFVNNTSHRSQFLSYDEMQIFDHWFSLLAHLFHEQEERRRQEWVERQVMDRRLYIMNLFLFNLLYFLYIAI